MRLFLWLFFITFMLPGCAYHAGFGDRSIPGGYQRVAVPVFKNQTHEVGIETLYTNAMIRELERSRLSQVSDVDSSQVTLNGTIIEVGYTPSTALTGNESNGLPGGSVLNPGYTIIVRVNMSLVRNSDNKVLWVSQFTGGRSYLTPRIGMVGLNSATALYNQSARFQNIGSLADDMMSEAHDRLTENF